MPGTLGEMNSTSRCVFMASSLATAVAAAHVSAQCSYSLAGQPTVPTALGPVSTVLADFSGDGVLDLAVACQTAGAVMFYPGNGSGGFNNGSGFGAGANPEGLCTGDFNNDGRPDFASTGHTGVVCIYRNVNGLPSATTTFFCGGTTPVGIATADFNQDGNLDLALTNSGSNTVAILMGNGAAAFGPPTVYAAGGIPMGITVGDFNQDGRPDLAVVNRGNNGVVSLYFCNPGGTFTPGPGLPTTLADPRSIVCADLTNDGLLDLVVGSWASTTNLGTFTATGPGTFAPVVATSVSVNSVYSLCVADMNLDGRPDLLVATGSQLQSRLTAAAPVGTSGATGLEGLSAGDLNGDGLPDVVAAGYVTDVYQVFRNTSASAPVITQHPAQVTTSPGVNAGFSVTASWSPTSYQWRRGGVNIAAGPGYSGVSTPSLTVIAPGLSDNLAVFDCVMSNTCGTVISRPAGLGVVDPCGTADFNGDGDLGTDADIEAFFRVLAGGSC
jgi:hypothetical protein